MSEWRVARLLWWRAGDASGEGDEGGRAGLQGCGHAGAQELRWLGG